MAAEATSDPNPRGGRRRRGGGLRWEQAGPLTTIDEDLGAALAGLPAAPVGLCRVAQGLVMLPHLAAEFGIPDDRQEERSIRSTADVLRRALQLDGAPIEQARSPDRRVIGQEPTRRTSGSMVRPMRGASPRCGATRSGTSPP